MGKNIVLREHPGEPNKLNQLWIHEDIKHVLTSDSVNEATRYMSLHITPYISLNGLRNFKRLSCLVVNQMVCKCLRDQLKIYNELPYLPDSLRYLYWEEYPYQCLPKTFEANNLVTLEMFSSKIEQLWEGRKVMMQLKFLDLRCSKLLKSLDLWLAPNLESLNLEGCDHLVKVYVQDGKVMEKLKVLSLGSTKLRNLDLGLMPNLERLLLQDCHDLVKLYVHGGCLKSLLYLDLIDCKNLKSFWFIELLDSLEVLRIYQIHLRESPDYIITWHCNNSLQELHLEDEDIEELPSSIGNLHKLVSMVLDGCFDLKCLPRSIRSLQHLKTLKVRYSIIKELPEDIGQLECLETLDITYAEVEHLPHSICMLKRLNTLILKECYVLEKLPEYVGQLESLVKLNLEDCHHLRDVPSSICKLKHFKKLKLKGCKRLEKLPDKLGDLVCLRELDIQNTGIIHLPPNLSLLKGLKIYRSELNDQIIDDDIIHSLCYGFQNLRTLDLGRCDIEELPEALGHLKCLEELQLSDTDVKHLPDSICMLKTLKKLVLQHCVLLEKLPNNVGHLESLEELDLSYCYSIIEIPNNICMLKQLKKLNLYHCFFLEKLPADVGQLESLEDLDITRCYNIREIPISIGMLKHLKILKLEGCRRVERLPDEVGVLECLQELNIWDAGISHLHRAFHQ